MKEFSLEKYLKNPNRKIVTRDGKSVRIVCTDRLDNNYPVVALVHDGDCEKCYNYTACGKFNTYQNRDTELDLFFAPQKKEGWINLFKVNSATTTGEVYNTEEEAKSAIAKSLVYISTVKVEWEE